MKDGRWNALLRPKGASSGPAKVEFPVLVFPTRQSARVSLVGPVIMKLRSDAARRFRFQLEPSLFRTSSEQRWQLQAQPRGQA
eukprot:9317214-Pyramimonas_sp.AAC.1